MVYKNISLSLPHTKCLRASGSSGLRYRTKTVPEVTLSHQYILFVSVSVLSFLLTLFYDFFKHFNPIPIITSQTIKLSATILKKSYQVRFFIIFNLINTEIIVEIRISPNQGIIDSSK